MGRNIRARKRRQRGRAIPLRLLASIGAGEIAKPILGKILDRGRRRRRIK